MPLRNLLIFKLHQYPLFYLKSVHNTINNLAKYNDSIVYIKNTNFTYSDFNASTFSIHSYLQFHMFNQSLQNAVPVLFQGCVSMSGYRDSSVFILHHQLYIHTQLIYICRKTYILANIEVSCDSILYLCTLTSDGLILSNSMSYAY